MGRVSKQVRQSALNPEEAENAAIQMYERQEAGKVRKRPDKTANLDPATNSAYIQHAAELLQLEPVNMDNAEQVKTRIFEYLEICEQSGMRPSQAGLALSFGIDRRRLTEIKNGKIPKPREVCFWLDKAYSLLNMMLESYMQDGRIQPLSGIFLLKNSFWGYTDRQEIQISTGTSNDTISPEDLDRKYADAIPTEYIDYDKYEDVPEE